MNILQRLRIEQALRILKDSLFYLDAPENFTEGKTELTDENVTLNHPGYSTGKVLILSLC